MWSVTMPCYNSNQSYFFFFFKQKTAYEIKRFTRFGFEWSYEGGSPQQLALAILFDRLGAKERAIKLCEPFMKTVVANLDNDWKLAGEEIDAFVRGLSQPQ